MGRTHGSRNIAAINASRRAMPKKVPPTRRRHGGHSDTAVLCMRVLRGRGASVTALADAFGVSKSFVSTRTRADESGVVPAVHHGHARHAGMTSEYMSWQCMLRRCDYPKNASYKNYGGRGISVCERWRASFRDFLADMGPKPTPKHTIDRVDPDGHYEPSNCRWASRAEQRSTQRARGTVPARVT